MATCSPDCLCESLAERIRRYRLGHGWSQEELAGRIGSEQSTVSLWERGTKTPRLASLRKLSAVFGITLDELVG